MGLIVSIVHLTRKAATLNDTASATNTNDIRYINSIACYFKL